MTTFENYQTKYTSAVLDRDSDGVLEVRLHASGAPLIWNECAHRELPELWIDIAQDAENRVVILAGTGDSFCGTIDVPSLRRYGRDKTYWEAKGLLQNLLDIEVPIIAAVNGPARVHAEIPVLSDVVLCSDTATFQDLPHFRNGMVPGDGVHVVWPALLGPNRGRYFLLTCQELSAQQALELGVVSEVLAPSALMPRAHDLAAMMAAKPTLTLRYTRACFVQQWKKLLLAELSHGLMLEFAAEYLAGGALPPASS
jgi:enoyl-CoA hydratase/carnithine racemase